jgi:hypothetical protein
MEQMEQNKPSNRQKWYMEQVEQTETNRQTEEQVNKQHDKTGKQTGGTDWADKRTNRTK